jgi:hypothetical protein
MTQQLAVDEDKTDWLTCAFTADDVDDAIRGSGPKVGAIFFFGGRPNFLKPSKLRKKQTDGEQRKALLLTTQ